jgi:hypothetical protein
VNQVSKDLLLRLPRLILNRKRPGQVGMTVDTRDWEVLKNLPCGHPSKVAFWASFIDVSIYTHGQLDLLLHTIRYRQLGGPPGIFDDVNSCDRCNQALCDFLIWYQESLRAFGDS